MLEEAIEAEDRFIPRSDANPEPDGVSWAWPNLGEGRAEPEGEIIQL